jgi:hypothetical protein
MATEELIQTPLKVDGVVKRSLHYSDEFWAAPPLAPTGTLDAADIPLQQKARRPATREEQSFQPLEDNDFLDAQTSFGLHRTRIAGTAIVAVVGITTLAYFWASAGEKKATQSAKPSAAMQASVEAPAQPSSGMPEPTPEPSAGIAWPDSPRSMTAEISPEIAPAAPTDNPSQRQTDSESQKQEFVFLQRPGVNIRSEPSTNGRVLGTARKGARLKVTIREGDWMRVESGRLKGWINSQFLATNEPR